MIRGQPLHPIAPSTVPEFPGSPKGQVAVAYSTYDCPNRVDTQDDSSRVTEYAPWQYSHRGDRETSAFHYPASADLQRPRAAVDSNSPAIAGVLRPHARDAHVFVGPFRVRLRSSPSEKAKTADTGSYLLSSGQALTLSLSPFLFAAVHHPAARFASTVSTVRSGANTARSFRGQQRTSLT